MAKTTHETRSARAPEAPAPAPAPTSEPEGSRFTVPLTKEGAIDFDRMQERTKEKLRQIASDPRIRPASAIASSGAAPAVFDERIIGTIYDALAEIEIAIAMRAYHCSRSQAHAHLSFSLAEKAAFTPPTLAVLNRYAGAMLEKYGAEVALLALVGTTTLGKFAALRADMAGNAERNAAIRSVSEFPKPAPAPSAQPDEPVK